MLWLYVLIDSSPSGELFRALDDAELGGWDLDGGLEGRLLRGREMGERREWMWTIQRAG